MFYEMVARSTANTAPHICHHSGGVTSAMYCCCLKKENVILLKNKASITRPPSGCFLVVSRLRFSHPSLRKHRSCLLRSYCSSPMRPHFLHNNANYGVNFLNTTTYFLLLSVDCAWFVSRLYHTFIARTNPKTPRGLARALSESALQFL